MKLRKTIIDILNNFGVKSFRTKNIVKHITISFFYKTFAILANFLLVPLTIEFLDTENYGVWLTLSSFITWFSFLDIGLGNGLRNKLTEAKSKDDQNASKAYISTAYFTILVISLGLFILFSVINNFIDWASVFNASDRLRNDLNILMPIIVGFFCIQLVTNLITSIYFAHQNHSIQVKIHFLIQLISLVTIWVLTKTIDGSLLIFGIVFSALPIVILLLFNLFAFSTKYKDISPSIKYWKQSCLKDIMGVGLDFFIIQIAGIVLFSTDNFIVTRLFSPNEVVPYNISFKYFSILTMVFTMVVSPYWSSFTEAFVKKEYDWIKISVKNILKFWLLIPVFLIIMLAISNWFYFIWLGDKVTVPFDLSLSMSLFVLIFTFNLIFVYFINGVGKIKLQLIISIISMIINIPLSVFFAEYLNLGLSGVILASCVSILASAILSPIQYYKIINSKAKGVWNI